MSRVESSVRISGLMQRAVVNRRGALLGHVKELLIDPGDGRIEYVLLALEAEPPGLPDRLVAVPWSALRPPGKDGNFLLDASPATLRAIRPYR